VSPAGAFGAESRAARIAYTVRASVAAASATAVWQGLDLTHGIWLVISAIMVLQPRCGETWAKGLRSGTYDPDTTTWVKVLNAEHTQRERHQLFENRHVAGGRR